MIYLHEPDIRIHTDPTFPENHGSFSVINYGLNDALKKLGYQNDSNIQYVGLSTSLDITWSMGTFPTFKIVVWELTNTLPIQLIQMGRYTRPLLFGMADQITNLYLKYGIPCRTVICGCNTDFYKQTKEKNKIFTFCHVNSSNLRSGLDLTLRAYHGAFQNRKDVQLIVKDTYDTPILRKKIKKFVDAGSNIKYRYDRCVRSEIRDLYSESHVCLNLLRMTSFGFPLLEAPACNCLSVAGDFDPTNVLNRPEYAVLLKPSKEVAVRELAEQLKDYGLHNNYVFFSYPEEPLIFDFDLDEYIATLKNIHENWESKYSKIDMRTPIVNNFKWESTAKQLVKYLNV